MRQWVSMGDFAILSFSNLLSEKDPSRAKVTDVMRKDMLVNRHNRCAASLESYTSTLLQRLAQF